jgi:hypothetical protein
LHDLVRTKDVSGEAYGPYIPILYWPKRQIAGSTSVSWHEKFPRQVGSFHMPNIWQHHYQIQIALIKKLSAIRIISISMRWAGHVA